MKTHRRTCNILAATAAAALSAAMIVAGPIGGAFSQQPPTTDKGVNDPGPAPDQHRKHQRMTPQTMQMHHQGSAPTLPGQDAFGAIQEVVRILEADPKTDWSKVDLEALRQHLIDMNEVTLKATAVAKPVDGGVEITVTGSDRTLAAIQRMVPAWAATMNGYKGWTTKAAPLPDGTLLTVTASDPKEVSHIRGLGFIGLMVSGGHHQPHHLAIAKGEFDPAAHRH